MHVQIRHPHDVPLVAPHRPHPLAQVLDVLYVVHAADIGGIPAEHRQIWRGVDERRSRAVRAPRRRRRGRTVRRANPPNASGASPRRGAQRSRVMRREDHRHRKSRCRSSEPARRR